MLNLKGLGLNITQPYQLCIKFLIKGQSPNLTLDYKAVDTF